MLTLYHHPFCPHSRFVRIVLGELGMSVDFVEERIWERREEFLLLNPAGTTPVLVDERAARSRRRDHRRISRRDARLRARERRLLPPSARARVEVRRLSSWFHDKFFAEVSDVLVTERVYRRHMPAEQGGGPPDTQAIRAARANIRYHLTYVGWLVAQPALARRRR